VKRIFFWASGAFSYLVANEVAFCVEDSFVSVRSYLCLISVHYNDITIAIKCVIVLFSNDDI